MGYLFVDSMFSLGPSETRSFAVKTRVIWVPGIYIYAIWNILIGPYGNENPSPPGLVKSRINRMGFAILVDAICLALSGECN